MAQLVKADEFHEQSSGGVSLWESSDFSLCIVAI